MLYTLQMSLTYSSFTLSYWPAEVGENLKVQHVHSLNPYIKRRNFIPFLYISVQNAFNQKRLTIHYYRISPSAATQGYFSCLRVKWCQFLTPGEGVNYSSTTVLMLFYDAIYRSLSVSRKTILYLDVFIWLSAMSDEILI